MLFEEQPWNSVVINTPSASSSGTGGMHRWAQEEEEEAIIGVGAAVPHRRAQQEVKDSPRESKEVEEDLGNHKAAIQLEMLQHPNRPKEASNNLIKEKAKASRSPRTKVRAKVLRM